MDTDSSPRADRTEVERLLHQLRSTLARLKAELELLRLDSRPPDNAVSETIHTVFTELEALESTVRGSTDDKNRLVVLIDDDQRLASAMSRQLQRYGLHCRVTTDIDDIAEFLPSRTRLVIDLSILRTASRSSLHRLRAFPTVVMSGSSDPLAMEEATFYGAGAYLTKPVDPEQLLQILSSLPGSGGLAPL